MTQCSVLTAMMAAGIDSSCPSYFNSVAFPLFAVSSSLSRRQKQAVEKIIRFDGLRRHGCERESSTCQAHGRLNSNFGYPYRRSGSVQRPRVSTHIICNIHRPTGSNECMPHTVSIPHIYKKALRRKSPARVEDWDVKMFGQGTPPKTTT